MFSERITVVGGVQGVGFRAHVLRAATALGVKGRVWNLPITGVGILAQHNDCDVLYDRFLRRVVGGPGKVGQLWCEAYEGEVFEDFQVTRPQTED